MSAKRRTKADACACSERWVGIDPDSLGETLNPAECKFVLAVLRKLIGARETLPAWSTYAGVRSAEHGARLEGVAYNLYEAGRR